MTALLLVALSVGAIVAIMIWPRGIFTALLTILVVALVSGVIGMFSTAAGIDGSYTGFGFFTLCAAVAVIALIFKINTNGPPSAF